MRTKCIRIYDEKDTEHANVTLSCYVLDDSPEMLRGQKRPAILICPGGAYLSCSDREAEPVALRFASMGYHAFVLRYSVYYQPGEMWNFDPSVPFAVRERSVYPAQLRETAMAMLILREHAQDWNIDTDRIAVCGFSAGAHNAAMYAVNWQTDTISEYFHKDKQMFRPAAAILGYTLSDYVYNREMLAEDPGAAAFFGMSNTAFLGTAEPSAQLLDLVSPSRHVTKYAPPTFLWAASEDEQVPVQHSIRMAHALSDANIPFELHVFEEGKHGLSLADQASSEALSQINADAAKWVGLAESWLRKRFALPLPQHTVAEEYLAERS